LQKIPQTCNCHVLIAISNSALKFIELLRRPAEHVFPNLRTLPLHSWLPHFPRR